MRKLAKSIASAIRRESPNLTYDQSKDLFKEVRNLLDLQPPRRANKGTVKRMSKKGIDRFLESAYEIEAKTGIIMLFRI